jgi:hypothetical protein
MQEELCPDCGGIIVRIEEFGIIWLCCKSCGFYWEEERKEKHERKELKFKYN